MPSTYSVSDDNFIDAVKTSISISESLTKMGLAPTGGNYKVFHLRVQKLGIDTSHFLGQGHLKGKSHSWSPKISLEELLVQDSNQTLSTDRKRRLIREGLLVEQCQSCGLQSEWNGKPLVLHIDHINGDHFDNRIENLRLLCPNCHSQTETYCSKNFNFHDPKVRPSQYPKQEKEIHLCQFCSKPLKSGRSTYCIDCYNSNRAELQSPYDHPGKIEWPPVEEILVRLEKSNYLQLSKELGVSDNAIRKHLKSRGIDPPKRLNAK